MRYRLKEFFLAALRQLIGKGEPAQAGELRLTHYSFHKRQVEDLHEAIDNLEARFRKHLELGVDSLDLSVDAVDPLVKRQQARGFPDWNPKLESKHQCGAKASSAKAKPAKPAKLEATQAESMMSARRYHKLR